MIDHIASCENSFWPMVFRYAHVSHETSSDLAKMPMFSLGHAILLWGIGTRSLMQYAICNKVLFEGGKSVL